MEELKENVNPDVELKIYNYIGETGLTMQFFQTKEQRYKVWCNFLNKVIKTK